MEIYSLVITTALDAQRMHSKGSRFTLGVWGLRVCSLDVARLFPTVRSRPQPFAWGSYGRAYGKFCNRGHICRFPASRCFVSRGRRGTSWQLCFVTCRKSFCVTGAILWRRFQKMRCSFRGRRSTLDMSIVILPGQAQHFKVLRACQGCVKWRQGANSVANVAFCEMWWKLAEPSHETSILGLQISGLRKTRRQTAILKLQVWKLEEVSHEMLVFAPTCLVSSLWFSCGLAMSRAEAAKLFLLEGVKASCNVVLRGRRGTSWRSHVSGKFWKRIELHFVWQAQYFRAVFTSLIACFVAGASLWRHPLSFCVAGAALQTCRVACFFCEYQCQGCVRWWQWLNPWQTWHVVTRADASHSTLYALHSTLCTLHLALCTLHSTLCTWHCALRTLCTLYTLHSTLYTPHFTLYITPHFTLSNALHFILHTLHSTLHTLHSTLYTPHSTLYTPHFTLHTPHFTLHTLHSTLHTLHSTLHTLHSTLYTPHSTLHTLRSTLYTLHFKLHTRHSTLTTLHFTLHTLHSTLYTQHSTLYTPHFAIYTPHSTLYTPHSTLYAPHSTLYTPHFTLHTLHSTLYTPRFTLYIHSTLHTLHSTLHTLHSTLYTQHSTLHSTLYTLNSTLDTPHSPLYTLHSTLCTPHFTLHPLPLSAVYSALAR